MSTQFTLDVQVLATWVGLLLAVIGAIVAGIRWLRTALQNEMREATAQIQPGANGGYSLADVNRAVTALTSSVKRLHDRLDGMDQNVRDLQVWAGDRPCLLDIEERRARAKRRMDAATAEADE